MINIVRTNSDNLDFQSLVALLDEDLKIRDGEEHAFYSQFNSITKIKWALVAFVNNKPVGSGALREYSTDTVEIKRMFVLPEYRGQGVARVMLTELQTWAGELNFDSCILETGKNQPEAIALYLSTGFSLIPNYGQYLKVENSVCMKKVISK